MSPSARDGASPEEYLPIVAERYGIGKERRCGGLAVARSLLREQLERIEETAVGVDLVMKVGPGRPAGCADAADDIAAVHARSLLHLEAGEMAVASLESEAMIDDDQVAVCTLIAGVRDAAGGRRIHRLTLVADNVEARIEVGGTVHRIPSPTHPRGEPTGIRTERGHFP